MTKTALLSLDDLDVEKHGETPFRYEVKNRAGEPTGVFLLILGGESAAVKAGLSKLVDDRRTTLAQRAANAATPADAAKVAYTTEEDMAFNVRAAAIRLAGWEGLAEPFTPENAERLCRSNRTIREQIVAESDKTANFLRI